ncbi:MAG TPA: tetratricopeptide repeat protein [Myxococcales bacterium]|nr:tetratricopeptide repeat protein [Myxococcales bacterium]
MDSALIALPAEFVELRREQIQRHGPLVIDVLLAQGACPKCGEKMASFAIGANVSGGYRSVRELVPSATRLAEGMAKQSKTGPCRACGSPTRVAAVQYHAHHAGLGQDIVVRWEAGKGLLSRSSVEVLRWDPQGGMAPAGDLGAVDDARFAHDVAFRDIAGRFEVGDFQNGVALLERLWKVHPGDPLLIRFVPQLMSKGYAKVSMAIAETHRKLAPLDPEGHYWSGEVLFQLGNRGLAPPETLPEVRAALEKALELRPDHLPTALALCNVFRGEKRLDEAKAAFLRLLERHPDCAEAHFDLAVMSLEAAPEEALHHFQQGERLQEKDPDYPVGVARALVRLGRKDEARQALARAKALAPEHPRYAELEAALA